MWWLSQAKLKDVLNRWICSSFQPMSAQNIPHLDPRGSWKHFCGTPGELNCPSLMYRMSCKRYLTKILSLGEAPRFGERNTRGRWSSHKPFLVPIPGVLGFVCSRVNACAVLQKLIWFPHCYRVEYLPGKNKTKQKRFSPNCLRELTKNCKLKGKGKEWGWNWNAVLANSWPKQGGKGQAKGCACGLVLWCN